MLGLRLPSDDALIRTSHPFAYIIIAELEGKCNRRGREGGPEGLLFHNKKVEIPKIATVYTDMIYGFDKGANYQYRYGV